MALKQLLLRKRIDTLNADLEKLRKKDEDFTTRKADLYKREAELEAAVEEMTADTSEEDRKTVDDSVAALETDQQTLTDDQAKNDTEKTKIEEEIRDLEKQLADIEDRSKLPPPGTEPKKSERKDEKYRMKNRMKFFGDMGAEQRNAIMAQDDVKQFVARVREFKGQKRSVTGAELQIPDVFLEILRDNLYRYSKLIGYVMLKTVSGKARQTIAGTVPEAIWTEAIGALNELDFTYSQVEVDGYKIGGFVAVPNSTLEDSDINLANDLMDGISQAIGLGLDKAILYGNKAKMLQGIVTRLAQTAKPSDWPANGRPWTDLHSTHILKINPSGITAEQFFAALTLYLGVAEPNYSVGGTFWVMNRKTKMTLLSKMIVFNAAGALVAGQLATMPIEGGAIVELPFIPDGDIVGGYGSLYLLAERAGANLAASDQVKFIEEQTVLKGSARYDGMPMIGEGFIILNIANADPTTSVTFAQDVANTVATPSALPLGGTGFTTSTQVFLSCATAGADIYYTDDGSTPTKEKTKYNGPITFTATKTIKAIAIKNGLTDSNVFSGTYTKST